MHPGMNSYVERLNGSISREALDHFLLISEKQIRKIIREYVDYHNHQRSHQGLGKIPDPESLSDTGSVCKTSVLGGLHHPHSRSSA